jgi:hypothetical protein
MTLPACPPTTTNDAGFARPLPSVIELMLQLNMRDLDPSQYGEADRREVDPPIDVESATWAAGGLKSAGSGSAGYAVPTANRDGSKPLIFDRPRVDLTIEGRVALFQPFQDFALPVKELPVDAVVRRTGPLLVPLVDRHDRRQLKHGRQVLGREEDRPLIEGLCTHSGTLRMNRASGADHHAFVIRSQLWIDQP